MHTMLIFKQMEGKTNKTVIWDITQIDTAYICMMRTLLS